MPKLNKKKKSKKLVNPVKPYNNIKPTNKKEEDIAPKMKYFKEDSAANIENLCVAANKYEIIVINSIVKKKKKKSLDIKQKQEPIKKTVNNNKGSGAPCLLDEK